jgi:Na+-transporting methylmalonyl-CoA/oxaloacetate decarboxylase gamma subunit
LITERVHPVTGEKYIEGKNKIIMESGLLLTPSEFAQSTMMSKEEAGALMQELSEREDRYRFDYKYALTTGILRHFQKKAEGNQRKSEENFPKTAENVTKLQKPKVQKKVSVVTIILLVMCVTGIMSACMSAYHSTKTLQLFGRPLFVGIITGTVMVMFSSTAFTAARWFWQEKGFVRGFSVVFLLLGLMVIAYSMLSTLTVNYTSWSKVEEVEKSATVENSEELAAYEAQVKLKTEELDEAVATEKSLTEEAEWWKNRSWKRYDELSAELTEQRKRVTAIRSELSSLLSSKPELASKVTEEKEDVFTFLAEFIKVQPKTLRLFMQAVPAMFFDIIAPFALSCAIYLAEKRKEEIHD